MDAAILRRIVEIQIEQGDLLKRFARSAANQEVNAHLDFSHVDFSHGGNDFRVESRREVERIEEHIERNQKELRRLVVELCQAPASAVG